MLLASFGYRFPDAASSQRHQLLHSRRIQPVSERHEHDRFRPTVRRLAHLLHSGTNLPRISHGFTRLSKSG